MDSYEKLIKTIRAEASKGSNGASLQLAKMSSDSSCMIGAMELDAPFLLVADHLKNHLSAGDVVLVVGFDDKFAIIERMVKF